VIELFRWLVALALFAIGVGWLLSPGETECV
jgi:hypothetical protein